VFETTGYRSSMDFDGAEEESAQHPGHCAQGQGGCLPPANAFKSHQFSVMSDQIYQISESESCSIE
jgi:hypothetical protein